MWIGNDNKPQKYPQINNSVTYNYSLLTTRLLRTLTCSLCMWSEDEHKQQQDNTRRFLHRATTNLRKEIKKGECACVLDVWCCQNRSAHLVLSHNMPAWQKKLPAVAEMFVVATRPTWERSVMLQLIQSPSRRNEEEMMQKDVTHRWTEQKPTHCCWGTCLESISAVIKNWNTKAICSKCFDFSLRGH